MNERTLFILQQLITKFFNLYQYLSLARMLTRGGHCCGTKPETPESTMVTNIFYLLLESILNTLKYLKVLAKVECSVPSCFLFISMTYFIDDKALISNSLQYLQELLYVVELYA